MDLITTFNKKEIFLTKCDYEELQETGYIFDKTVAVLMVDGEYIVCEKTGDKYDIYAQRGKKQKKKINIERKNKNENI